MTSANKSKSSNSYYNYDEINYNQYNNNRDLLITTTESTPPPPAESRAAAAPPAAKTSLLGTIARYIGISENDEAEQGICC